MLHLLCVKWMWFYYAYKCVTIYIWFSLKCTLYILIADVILNILLRKRSSLSVTDFCTDLFESLAHFSGFNQLPWWTQTTEAAWCTNGIQQKIDWDLEQIKQPRKWRSQKRTFKGNHQCENAAYGVRIGEMEYISAINNSWGNCAECSSPRGGLATSMT